MLSAAMVSKKRKRPEQNRRLLELPVGLKSAEKRHSDGRMTGNATATQSILGGMNSRSQQ